MAVLLKITGRVMPVSLLMRMSSFGPSPSPSGGCKLRLVNCQLVPIFKIELVVQVWPLPLSVEPKAPPSRPA